MGGLKSADQNSSSRGINEYEPLLETHDAEQDPQKGGLLYARYGKGAYIYNAYAFYRQLPLGVPGAYRIFANMLSLPKNPQFQRRQVVLVPWRAEPCKSTQPLKTSPKLFQDRRPSCRHN